MTKHYHHGDLASSIIAAAIPLLDEDGPNQLSLRHLARIAGVSHGAPAHHFGGKTGLLTQVAILGHQELAASLRSAVQKVSTLTSPDKPSDLYITLIEAGKAYVRFALKNPGFFSVMFQTDIIDAENETYIQARSESRQVLEDCVLALSEGSKMARANVNATLTALWSQVHGFSVLWLSGNFGDPSSHETLETQLEQMLMPIEPRL